MALNSTHFFDVYPISPKSNRVAHPDSGMLGETLHDIHVILCIQARESKSNAHGNWQLSMKYVPDLNMDENFHTKSSMIIVYLSL